MPFYAMLMNWTDQGIRNVKESPNRLDAFKKILRASGGELSRLHPDAGPVRHDHGGQHAQRRGDG